MKISNIVKSNYFIWVVLLSLIQVFINNTFLNTNDLLLNFYSEQLAEEQLKDLIEGRDKWLWVSYALIPLLILIRSSLVALCLNIGLFFYNPEKVVKFKQLFRVALLGEFVLVLVGYCKFFYFTLIKTEYSLEDVQQFYPLSYINFFDTENIEAWLIYPLQTINLFELAYFFVLAYGMYKLLKNKYWKSFEIASVSYGTGLIIWMGIMMFITLNMS